MTNTIELYREIEDLTVRSDDEDARWEVWEALNSGWQAFDSDNESTDDELF
jgi:hypothetical protein